MEKNEAQLAAPKPGSRLGAYLLGEQLGRGGMGLVFAAVNEHIGQEVALKVLPDSSQDPMMQARLLQEGRALAQLTHPGIVRVLTCDQTPQGLVYLVMERLRGISLKEWLHNQPGPKPWSLVSAIGAQIATALCEMHARGIYHRDLTPSNIMLSFDPEHSNHPSVKIIDFGLAKMAITTPLYRDQTQIQTGSGGFLGTPGYASPEQFRDSSQVDQCTDVYALGIILYECLTGTPPFVGDPVSLALGHMRTKPILLRTQNHSVPRWLSHLVSKMLDKDPHRRPSMTQVFEELRSQKRPRRVLLWSLAGMGLLLVVALLWGFRQVPRTTDTQSEILLEQMLVDVERWLVNSDWSLAQLPHTLEERRRVLARYDTTFAALPADLYQHSAQRHVVVQRSIEIRHRAGDLSLYHGLLRDAQTDYKHAEQQIRSLRPHLASSMENDSAMRLLKALNHSKQGKVALAQGDLKGADTHFSASVDLLRTFFGASPADDEVRRVLSVSLQEQGQLRLQEGRAAEALRILHDAEALLSQSSDEDDGWLKVEASVYLARALPKGAEPEAVLLRVLAEQSIRVNRAPSNLMYRATLARIHGSLASVYGGTNKLTAALISSQKGLKLAREVQVDAPTDKRYALLRCDMLKIAATLAFRNGQARDAWQHREECRLLVHTFSLRDPMDRRFAQGLIEFPRQ